MRIPSCRLRLAGTALVVCGFFACASTYRPFPLRAPLRQDGDLRPVAVHCRTESTKNDPHHVSCAPEVYESPIIWDGADNMVFRPLAESLGVIAQTEAANVNSFDEVPDSAWFTNRPSSRPVSIEELRLGACAPAQILEPDTAADGSWVIDKGKANGSTAGFRVSIPGKGKYLFKAEEPDQPERPSAASVIGAAVYGTAGFNTSCEQIVYFKPSLLTLTPGLRSKGNFSAPTDFDRQALDKVLADCPHRDGLVRMQASAWLPGYLIGAFRYEGTRGDDPSDVVAHQNRRELRGGRLLAAWIDHHDAREQNTMDSWIAESKDPPDSSPGRVVHYYLDTSECLGSEWQWDEVSRRLGHSYIVDWGDLAADFVTLGIPVRPWDRVKHQPGLEIFGYFDVENFDPEGWKNEYANPAFSRMTERDGAWMARVLARFTPAMVKTLAEMGQFTNPAWTAYLAEVLEGRLERILNRYLTRLSPIAELHVEGTEKLCGIDVAEARAVREPDRFQYGARLVGGGEAPVTKLDGGRICAALPHVAPDGGSADGAPERYVRVRIDDGVAKGPLIAHLYDLGPTRGYVLVGVERPEE
jgi:hypothetical protein